MIRRDVWLLLVMMIVCATGCGRGASLEASPMSPESTENFVDPHGVTSCQDLIDSEWTPPAEGHPQVDWDPTTGDAHFKFTEKVDLHLNVRTDAACTRVAILGPMVTNMLTSHEEDQRTVCEHAVALVLKGEPPRKGDIVGDLEGLRNGIQTDCPPLYEERLRAAGK